MSEYIYIRQVNQASVHIGRTMDLEQRYRLGADQLVEDFNDYICAFECKDRTGQQIENDVKKEFKKYHIEREIYNCSAGLLKDYKSFLLKHKDVIRELEEEEVLKYNKNDKDVKFVIKVQKQQTKRNLKELGWDHKDMQLKSQNIARAIQKNNDISKYTEHDEFFTRYEDIEEMIEEVKEQFKGKVVFCNCDDPLGEDEMHCSAFALYFKKNFKKLKLKKLICLHFAGVSDIFNTGETIGMIYNYDGTEIEIKREGDFDGSFMHPKSIKILNEEADIVCTNHPWSLTQQYYKILFESKKRFLVISNSAIVLIPSFFEAVKNRKIKAIKRCENFLLGKNRSPARATGAWMTNLKYNRMPYKKLMPLKDIPRNEILVDDNGVLNINNGYIPNDYDKEFAVSSAPIIGGILEQGFEVYGNETYLPKINGKIGWRRLLIKKSQKN